MAPIDWSKHWKLNEEPECATQFALEMAEKLRAFIDEHDVNEVADIGCGPASTLFELARTYPSLIFYGFDIANTVVTKNRERAEREGLHNILFECEVLPHPRTLRKFDLVLCFSTLHYVEEVQEAILSLFGLVKPEGYLVFNYPNIHSKRAKENEIQPNDELMLKRFSVLLSGVNITSQREIKHLLGITPKKFYSSKIFNIYLIIRKPNQ